MALRLRFLPALFILFAFSGLFAQDKTNPQNVAANLKVLSRSPWAITAKLKCGNPLASCPEMEHFAPQVNVPTVGAPRLQPHVNTIESSTFIPVAGFGVSCKQGQGCAQSDGSDLVSKPLVDDPFAPVLPSVQPTIPRPAQGSVTVLWESAEPVRAAMSKLGIPVAVASTRSAYIISVAGYSVREAVGEKINFEPSAPEEIKQLVRASAVLVVRGDVIRAFDVQMEGNENDMTLRYFFPTDRAITSSDGEVQYKLQVLLGRIVEAKFKVKDMMSNGRLELPQRAANP